MNSTIAAVATAGGVGSIAIVRLSGPDALSISRKIAIDSDFIPRQAELTSLYNFAKELIDRAIVIYFQAPRSFTGEDTVEFQCHGGQIVADEILAALMASGARLAEPGEFSKRAFLNGKIDLSEAEAIAKLIEAKSVDAARLLARQLKGGLGDFVADVRERLLRAMAHSEVMIDYAEDVPDNVVDGLVAQLSKLREYMQQLIASSKRRKGLIEGFRVVIIGKPNVGKSSLLNALLDYDRAIVTDIAGTTRDTVEEQVRIGSHLVRLIDTAGIHESDDTIEKIGVYRSLSSIKDADIVIAMFDGSRALDDEDDRVLDLIGEMDSKECIVVKNKNDLPGSLDRGQLSGYDIVEISTQKDSTPLIERLSEVLDKLGQGDDLMLVSARQIEAVEQCESAISEAIEPLRNGELELFSYQLRDALSHIGSITHPYENEEILDRMFGEFCLGK